MAGVPYSKQISVSGDILSAWEAISNGVVGQNHQTREKYWKHWSSYTQQFNKDKYLDTCNEQEQIIIITAFAARVRSGHYGKGRIVKAQSVSQALAAISKTIELVGKRSPIYQTEKTYKTPVTRLLEGYRREDPPSTPQLAVPVAVPEACFKMTYKTNNPPPQRCIAAMNLCSHALRPVLLLGEMGVGKTLMMREKLRSSNTLDGTQLTINCDK